MSPNGVRRSRSAARPWRRPPAFAVPRSSRAFARTAPSAAANTFTSRAARSSTSRATRSPINEGTLCPKGANSFQLSVNPHRVQHVLYRAPYSDHWEQKPLDWAMDRIAEKVKQTRDEGFRETSDKGMRLNSVTNMGTLGGATLDNEENYLIKKLFGGRPRRRVHREPGADMTQRFGARSGRLVRPRRGHHLSAGPRQQRLHPVHGFQHGGGPSGRLPLADEGQGEGRKLLHVDPRFTRMSALCDLYVGIRAGSDIAFLGGIINYVLTHERWFKEYVLAYTNASTLIEEGYEDAEDNGGVFSGYDKKGRSYDGAKGHWGYEGSQSDSLVSRVADLFKGGGSEGAQGVHGPGLMGGSSSHKNPRGSAVEEPGGQPPRDETLQHPRCVLQILRRHFARYTPELVADVCGCTPEQMVQVAETLCDNSGRDAPAPSSTPSAGRSTAPACRSSAPPASCNCCWATSADPAAASWPCAATPASRGRPTSPRCTTCCRATCRSRRPRSITTIWTRTSSMKG